MSETRRVNALNASPYEHHCGLSGFGALTDWCPACCYSSGFWRGVSEQAQLATLPAPPPAPEPALYDPTHYPEGAAIADAHLSQTPPPAPEPVRPGRGWLVIRKRDTGPCEVDHFERYDQAAMFFEAATTEWDTVYFARVAHCEGHPLTPVPASPDRDGLPTVAGDRLDMSYAQFERRCRVQIAREQKRLDCDSALVGLLCDAVRLTREATHRATQPIASPDRDEAARRLTDAVMVCRGCGGRGWYSGSEHAPDCQGECRNCPIEVQIECDCHNMIRQQVLDALYPAPVAPGEVQS